MEAPQDRANPAKDLDGGKAVPPKQEEAVPVGCLGRDDSPPGLSASRGSERSASGGAQDQIFGSVLGQPPAAQAKALSEEKSTEQIKSKQLVEKMAQQ